MQGTTDTFRSAVKQGADWRRGEGCCGVSLWYGAQQETGNKYRCSTLWSKGTLLVSSEDASLFPSKCKAENKEPVSKIFFLKL